MKDILVAKVTQHGEPAVIMLAAYKPDPQVSDVIGEILYQFPRPEGADAVSRIEIFGPVQAPGRTSKVLDENAMFKFLHGRAQQLLDAHIDAHYSDLAKWLPFANRAVAQPGGDYVLLRHMQDPKYLDWAWQNTDSGELRDALDEIRRARPVIRTGQRPL